ncbi:leucine-rich PPR motif-containing protein, mitochondrial [Trichonephila inaurata madagascariensis]|uniref:Leucine-rich PPR motif-containing protein, mitochondrial n=1 Tax=Trichonephila inaurata madagascariensis TaxID=2747483 RepID=A0A8X7CSU6_9ARAC|nr:leucine-rich PPR motif-containing protein, mitochondrial [Trichonephila inaurata madagascariensis]
MVNRDLCFINQSAINPVSRYRCLTTDVQRYSNSAVKINVEFKNSTDATANNIDSVLSELDFSIRRTGRSTKRTVENILSMIEKHGSATDDHGLFLLRSCALMYGEKPAYRCETAKRIWEKLHELNSQIDVRHYNSLLKIFTNCNHEFSAPEFLASMEKSKVEPNKITYLLLMQKYCNDGDLDGASEILECLKEKGISINVSVFNLLIKGYMKANDVSGAKNILVVMKSAGLSPNAESYANLACGHAANGNVDGIKSALQDAKNNDIVLSSEDYLSIITSLSSTVCSDYLNELLTMLQNVHVWRSEIMNAVMELIHKGSDENAFKLLLTVASPENYCATNFVKQLIKCQIPFGKIIEYCKKISDLGIHDYIFMNTQKAAIEFGNMDLLFALLEVKIEKGISVRTHDFHPIFFYYKDKEESIWLTLKKMYQFGIPSDFNTYTNWIFPTVSTANPKTLISNLQETRHSLMMAIDPLFEFYCYKGQFENAYSLTEGYPVCILPSFNLERFVSMYNYIQTNQKAYLKVLNYVLKNMGLYSQNAEIRYGKNLAKLVQLNPSLFKTLYLKHNELFGCSLSNKSLGMCSDILRSYNPKLLDYFLNLTTFEKISNPVMEENKLNSLKGKVVQIHEKKRMIDNLTFLLKNPNNASKINELKEELDKLEIQYPPILLSKLLYFYCCIGHFEGAKQALENLKENHTAFEIDFAIIIDYATMLIKFSKLDEAVDVIKMECKPHPNFAKQETVLQRVKQLFNVTYDIGSVELVQNLLSSFLPLSRNLKSNIFYEPLIKVHLHRNDLDSAIEEFEKCVKNFQVAPCLRILMKRCIILGNLKKLEMVMETAICLKDKQVVLWELICAFFDAKKKSEALKVLESRNNIDAHHVEEYCTQLYDQGRISDLLEFIVLICSRGNTDKEKIVSTVFTLIDNKNDFKTALDLYGATKNLLEWRDTTKRLFLDLLSRNEQQVPLNVSENISSKDFVISA